MQHKEFKGTWKEIWTQKGEQEGSKEDALEYGGWDKTLTPAEEIVKKLVDFMHINLTDKVLEIGCGAGGMAQYMDCDYVGIDFSRPSTLKCMEFFQKPALCAEADNLPFKDNYFDYSFAYGCFMYFPDMEYADRVVSEMKRVSKKGILIGELPTKSHESKHLLFTKKHMESLNLTIMGGWAENYKDVRFSAYLWK